MSFSGSRDSKADLTRGESETLTPRGEDDAKAKAEAEKLEKEAEEKKREAAATKMQAGLGAVISRPLEEP